MPPTLNPPPAAAHHHSRLACLSSRLATYSLFSVALAASLIASAFHQHTHFYAAGISLAKSHPTLLALLNLLLLFSFLFAKLVQALVFGPLRVVEAEHLYERSWVTVTEILLAMTTFRHQFNSRFAVDLSMLLFLKVFHWITADRVDIMQQLPFTPFQSHFRLQIFIACMLTVDYVLCRSAIASISVSVPTAMFLFSFEYSLLAASMTVTAIKYALNLYDSTQENGWELKSKLVFYIDLVHDLFKLLNYLALFALIFSYYGLPLHALRDLYLTLRSFLLKLRDLHRYHRANRNLNDLYPSATAEDLDRLSDRTCIICREDMFAEGNPNESTRNSIPKRLPCGHTFHFGCLRSWMERQQSCPTCRRLLLDTARPPVNNNAAPVNNNAAPVNNNAAPVNNNAAPVNNNAAPVNNNSAPAINNPAPAMNNAAPARNQTISNVSQQSATSSSQDRSPMPAATAQQVPSIPTPVQDPDQGLAIPPEFTTASLADLLTRLSIPPPPPPPPPFYASSNFSNAVLPDMLTDQELAAFTAPIRDRQALEVQLRTLHQVQSALSNASLQLTQIMSVIPHLQAPEPDTEQPRQPLN